MEAIYHAFQHWMLCACLAGLGMIAALVFLAKVAAPAWDAVRRWWSLPCIQRILVGVCVVGLSYYGATKQGWHVAYDGGIKAGATANVVTNDTVSIHWQRDTSGGVYVPESAAVYIDYRPNTETNAEWGLLAQTTVGAWGWSGTVENATNYDYNVWAYYIPPEPVHTNGVWTYKTHFDRRGEYALPLRARVEVNGVAIATPKEKRKDEATYSRASLLAMWDGIDHGNDPLIWRDLSGNGNDATQRVATGWSWADKSYVGVGPNNGFRVPQTFSSALREAVEHHTVELVFKPNSWRRQTIFGQYNGNVGAGLSYEFYNRAQSFRAYYYAMPDYSVEAWSSTQMQRMTVAVVCDGSQLSIYVDGVKTGQSYQPTANTIHEGLSMIIGGENSRSNMSIGGALFCVRVYSRSLTEEELKRHVKIDNERFD